MIIFQSVLLSRFISNWRKDKDLGQDDDEGSDARTGRAPDVREAKTQESSSEASNRQ